MKNILVIGIGPHARRTHLPALAAGQARGLVGTISGVDIRDTRGSGSSADTTGHGGPVPLTLVDRFDPTSRRLPEPVRRVLDDLVRERRIDAVVVATEPAVHLAYTRWALDRDLSVLLDKPVTARRDCSTDPAQAHGILDDFDDLLECCRRARQRDPRTLVTVLCQRRYHPAFRLVRERIAEITAATGCPVTSIQAHHSDGQWRLPDELRDLSYHGFEQGYGKIAHSGYHFLDLVPWLLAAGETDRTRLDSADVHAAVARPRDVLAQLGSTAHERLMPGFADRNPYTEHQLRRDTHGFGEVDAMLSLTFRSRGHVMTLGGVTLLHNGFSQRGGLTAANSDLYRGNGRVRHETLILHQGPFQTVHVHSLQTLPGTVNVDDHAPGGALHVEIHVFRNGRLRGDWQTYTHYDPDAITTAGGAEPTQEAARRRAIEEFLDYLHGRRAREDLVSDLDGHRRGVALMAGAYLSTARQWEGGPSTATVDFTADVRPAPACDRTWAGAAG